MSPDQEAQSDCLRLGAMANCIQNYTAVSVWHRQKNRTCIYGLVSRSGGKTYSSSSDSSTSGAGREMVFPGTVVETGACSDLFGDKSYKSGLSRE